MSETSQTSSENEKTKPPRVSRKRQVHNEVERRRKDKINNWIAKIGELLPNAELHKQSKISTLEQTVDYIKELAAERDKLLINQCSEVQVQEIKTLKRNLKLLEEQNALYAKLLKQASISLTSIPKKASKYSNKFSEKSGAILLQKLNAASTTVLLPSKPTSDTSKRNNLRKTQSGTDHSGSTSTPETSNPPSLVETTIGTLTSNPDLRVGDVQSSVSKDLSTSLIGSVPFTISAVCVSHSNSSMPVATSISQLCAEAQGLVPLIANVANCGTVTATPPSAGGVTSALSPFPLMSTTHNSPINNIYSKSTHVIILPTGANFVQPSPVPSNVAIINSSVENVLPIIVPRQLQYVPASVNATVLSSASESARNALLNKQFNCPQEPIIGTDLQGNVIHYVPINSFSVAPSNVTENSSVLPATILPFGKFRHSSLTYVANTLPSVVTLSQEMSISSSRAKICENINATSVTSSKPAEKVNEPRLESTQKSANVCTGQIVASAGTSVPLKKSDSANQFAAIATKDLTVTTKKNSFNQSHIRNTTVNSKLKSCSRNAPPSLQVLSANKIISLANQSQAVPPTSTPILKLQTSVESLPISSDNKNVRQNKQMNAFDSHIISPYDTYTTSCNTISTGSPIVSTCSNLSTNTTTSLSCVMDKSQLVNENLEHILDHFSTDHTGNAGEFESSASTLNSFMIDCHINTNEKQHVQTSCIEPIQNTSPLISDAVKMCTASAPMSTITNSVASVCAISGRETLIPTEVGTAAEIIHEQPNVLSDESFTQQSVVGVNFNKSKSSSGNNTSEQDFSPLLMHSSTPNTTVPKSALPHTVDNGQGKKDIESNGKISLLPTVPDTALRTSSVENSLNQNTNSKAVLPLIPASSHRGVSIHQTSSVSVSMHEHSLLPKSNVCDTASTVLPNLSNLSEKSESTSVQFSRNKAESNIASESTTLTTVLTENAALLASEADFSQTFLPSLYHKNQILNSPVIVNHPIISCSDGSSKIASFNGSVIYEKSVEPFAKFLPNIPLMCSNASFVTDMPLHSESNKIIALSQKNLHITASVAHSVEVLSGSTLSAAHKTNLNENNDTFPGSKQIAPDLSNRHKTKERSSKSNAVASSVLDKSKRKQLASNSPEKKTRSPMKKCKLLPSLTVAASFPDVLTHIDNYYAFMHPMQEPVSSDKKCSQITESCDSTGNFNCTSDILAKATESIFGSNAFDTMEEASKDAMQNRVLNVSNVEYETTGTFSSSDVLSQSFVLSDIMKTSEDKGQEVVKSASTGALTKMGCNRTNFASSCDIPTSNKSSSIVGGRQDTTDSDIAKPKHCSKSKKIISEGEPVSKKAKENHTSIETEEAHSYIQQLFTNNAASAVQTNALESRRDNLQSLDNVAHSQENVLKNMKHNQQTESDSKTVSSVETTFSSTYSNLEKDAPHSVPNFDSRNTNFAMLPPTNGSSLTGKNKSSTHDAINDPNRGYLELPDMYLPTVAEVSTTSICHPVENIFENAISSCSNQSKAMKIPTTVCHTNRPNKKKNDELVNYNEKHTNEKVVSFANNWSNKDTNSVTKLLSNSNAQIEIITTKAATHSAGLFPHQRSGHVPAGTLDSNNCTKSSSDQFGMQNGHTSIVTSLAQSNIHFYPVSHSVPPTQQTFQNTCPPPLLSRNPTCRSNVSLNSTLPFTPHTVDNLNKNTQQTSTNVGELSHSLCSLLKQGSPVRSNSTTTNIPVSKNTVCASSIETSSSGASTNISQSKYSALSLISNQTCLGSSTSSTTGTQCLQSSSLVTPASCSSTQPSALSCNRSPAKTSLSYSAERLIQTQYNHQEKDKARTMPSSYPHFMTHKKTECTSGSDVRSLNKSNIFMPLTNSEMNVQNMPPIPLPPVTSFPSFPSGYSMCDAGPVTSIFNSSIARSQDVIPSLSKDNSFLNTSNLGVESEMQVSGCQSHNLGVPPLPKSHPNLSLTFDSHGNISNSCNFLQHPKPALDVTRSTTLDNNTCFQPMFSNGSYSQQVQKHNCCHFGHRATSGNSGVTTEKNLPLIPPIPSFHTEKVDNNRPSLENNFSQNTSSYIGNIFYEPSKCLHEGVAGNKPSIARISQDTFVPIGSRQSAHKQNPSVLNQRKTAVPSKTKSKKSKHVITNDNVNGTTAFNANSCMNLNFYPVPDISCSKAAISHITNSYFKNTPQSIIPTLSELPNQQNKISDPIASSMMPTNTAFSPNLHQQGDNFLNLNFQPTNFTASPLTMHPPPALSCTCPTSSVVTHTFTSAPHPVPNFNLSNILPDMGCSSADDIGLSPIKFPPSGGNAVPQALLECQPNSTANNSTHAISRQSCGPSLYPPHPPVVHNSLTPLLNHGPYSFNSHRAPMPVTGSVSSVVQSSPFTPTQTPPFRDVIHSLNSFPRSGR